MKKFKDLYVKLNTLNETKVAAILEEWFVLCKMIFRIKATINYTWGKRHSIHDIIDLFRKDEFFRKMQELAARSMSNLFSGTSKESIEPIGKIFPPKKG